MATRPVRIDPERPSVRLMGTRFVIDSWIMDQLVAPNVSEPPDLRVLASPLDLAAAFGSDFALAIQDEAGETAYLHYPEQMAAMRAAVAARPDEAWGETVYDAWLAAVEPMWLPHGAAFPDFMQSDAWKAKSQQAGFGSYAELRHDTILYTKQFVGEMGSVAADLPEVRNWVEPDPVAFGRLSAMATLTRDGLAARELLPKEDRPLAGRLHRVRRPPRGASRPTSWPGSPSSRVKGSRSGGRPTTSGCARIGGELEGFWWRSGDKLQHAPAHPRRRCRDHRRHRPRHRP